jgi:RND superfamily putative drug exporter
VRRVFHAFNTRGAEFRGRDGRTSLILVMPAAPDFYHAERLVPILRDAVRSAGLPTGFAAHVTGTPALYHDLDRSASDDLLRAERIGIPLTLAILLVVFGAPLAAALPLVLATAAVTLSLAGLWILSGWMPVGVFAQNAASMIGLGVGVDYALFILSRWRRGESPTHAGRDHLHYRLLDLGLGQRQIVVIYYLFCLCFGGLALVASSRLFKLMALLVMGVGTLIALWWLARKTVDGRQ